VVVPKCREQKIHLVLCKNVFLQRKMLGLAPFFFALQKALKRKMQKFLFAEHFALQNVQQYNCGKAAIN